MVLNRAAKKEAEARLGMLRKPVDLEVFTLRFEDSVCRETRQTAEELAETSARLAVEISDALESGDLLRKHRVDAMPAITVTAKDSPEYRIYGTPGAFGFSILLEAVASAGALIEPKPELVEICASLAGIQRAHSRHLDLVLSRRAACAAEAAAALWRVLLALKIAAVTPEPVAAVRIVEDFPFWAARCADLAPPVLFLDGKPTLGWPFADTDIAELLNRRPA